MGRKQRLTKKAVIDALRETRGGVYLAADLLKRTPGTIYNYINKHPDIKEVKESFTGKLVDKAEYNLHEAVEQGDPWAVKYALSTQGKSRGYTERQEITGAEGAPVVYELKWAEDEHSDSD